MSQEKTEIREIELKSQYGKWHVVLDNPNAKRLTIFMLGDRHKGFIPPQKWIEEFNLLLRNAMEGKDNVIVATHPFISCLQVDLPEGPVAITTPDLDLKKMNVCNQEWLKRLIQTLEHEEKFYEGEGTQISKFYGDFAAVARALLKAQEEGLATKPK